MVETTPSELVITVADIGGWLLSPDSVGGDGKIVVTWPSGFVTTPVVCSVCEESDSGRVEANPSDLVMAVADTGG
jgi:hypothetical protein